MNPLISFVIPTLNEEKVIAETLQKLRKLKAYPYEIIISDGHSSDRTVEIAKEYVDVLVEHDGKTRQNIAQGRNAGAQVAKGEYLVFLDADVEIGDMDLFFEKALEIFQKNPQLIALGVFVEVLPRLARRSDVIIMSILNHIWTLMNNTIGMAGVGGEFQMIKKEAFQKMSGYDQRLVAGEDFDLFARLAQIGKTWIDPSLSVYHTGRRVHKLGWPKLLSTWFTDWLSMKIFHRSVSQEWKVIR